MTTIATDGKTIAADSLSTSAGHILNKDEVKIHRINGEVIGCAGAVDDCMAYIDWIKNGGNAPEITRGEFNALHVSKKGAYLVCGGNLKRQQVSLPTAIGHGAEKAEGAMLAGASPKRAVKIACSTTTMSGGKIRSMKIV